MIESVEILRGEIALRSPFRTSFGEERVRDLLYVRVLGGGAEGWGECVAMRAPSYSSEFVDGCEAVLRRFLVPLLGPTTRAEEFVGSARAIRGHPMAKAALEAALLDFWLRIDGVSLADRLGATRDRVPAGVSVGIHSDVPSLLTTVQGFLGEGYVRIKLKIEPGHDVEPVRAVRREFGDDVLLQVDANAAYTVADADHLAGLDEFGLVLIEQPLAEDDLVGHVELTRRLSTPICLDESITSLEVARGALDIGACSIINVKPGRIGGYLESVAIHDLCLGRGIPVWCGGMLETGIGRAANLALAALPGFTLPGDTSASDRYFVADVTEPFELRDGHVAVPTGPGIGVAPLPERLADVVTRRESLSIGHD